MASLDNYLRFPLDLGSDQQGHFMKILIYPSGSQLGSNPSTPNFNSIGSFVQSITNSNPNATKTICLFIPGGGVNGPMIWEMEHSYDEVKLAKLGMGIIGAVSETGADVIRAGETAARLLGQGKINPKVDVLYSNSNLRKFQFSHFMAPSSANEYNHMQAIIRLLRKYSAPELTIGDAQGQTSLLKSGYWFVPPAEFEISFYNSDGENPNIPKIGRCVLEHIDVNYTQQGEFSTFTDGAPTSAQLTMQFREMRIISQADIDNGY